MKLYKKAAFKYQEMNPKPFFNISDGSFVLCGHMCRPMGAHTCVSQSRKASFSLSIGPMEKL